jgi:hypothetical protein
MNAGAKLIFAMCASGVAAQAQPHVLPVGVSQARHRMLRMAAPKKGPT